MARSRSMLLAGLAAGVALVAQPACAQDNPGNTSKTTANQAASGDLGENAIIVTANRRRDTVQNIGGGITALSGSDLSRMHAATFNDFATTVPGLSFQSNSPTNNLIAIRGVASSTAELGSAIGVYFNDVPIGASTQFGLGSQSFNFNLWDMERVEVLKGPQGTLYGANSLGGAIKYITRKPQLGVSQGAIELDGSLTSDAAANGSAKLMLNVPLGDTLALRVDAIRSQTGGWGSDPTHNRSHLGTAQTLGGRASLLWQPVTPLKVRLTAFAQRIKANGLNIGFYNIGDSSPQGGPYEQNFALEQPSTNSVAVFSGNVSYDFGWGEAVSVTGYQINHGYYITDDSVFYGILIPLYTGAYNYYFGTPIPGPSPYALYVDTNTRKFTQEFRLQSASNHHFEWVVGAYYTHENTDEQVNLLYTAGTDGNMPAPYDSYPFYGFLPSVYKEIAGYGDVTAYLGRIFDLTLGIRYSHQNQTYSSNIWWIGFGPTIENNVPVYGTPQFHSANSSQSVATYLINPRLHLSRDVMIYGKVSSGFRPGGPNFFLGNANLPSSFQPDKLWNYEIGEKGSFFNQRLTVNVDAYDIEWKNIQTTENVNGINQLVNAGNARIRGVEGMVAVRPVKGLSLNGSGSYTDAYLTTTAPALGVTYTGARLPLSPRWNFAVGATYRFSVMDKVDGTASLTDVWVGERNSGYAGSATNVLYKLPAYNTVNASLAFDLRNGLRVSAFVRNLFDSKGQLSAVTLNNVFLPDAPVPVTIAQPRTVGLSIKYSWGQS